LFDKSICDLDFAAGGETNNEISLSKKRKNVFSKKMLSEEQDFENECKTNEVIS
jgi:hypothetical protein